MSRGVPTVKDWKIRVEGGGVYYVTAPTRQMAILNLRFDHFCTWGKKLTISMWKGARPAISYPHTSVLVEQAAA